MHFSRTALLVIALIVLASLPLCLAEDRPLVVAQEWVTEQITKLDADTLQDRTTAERTLLAAGPDVLPFLPAPELLPNTAVRQAVRRIRLRLEEAKARESVKASTVTINGSLPLKDILKQITEQTGNRLDTTKLPKELLERSVPVEIGNIYFWHTLDIIGEYCGFERENLTAGNESSPAVRLVPARAESRHRDGIVKGAFLIDAHSLQFKPRVGVADRQLLRVPIRISPEPRVRPLFLKVAGADFSIVTPKLEKLPPFNPDAKLELPLGEAGTEISFNMDFDVPKPFDEKRVTLDGKVTMTVAAASEEFRFSDLTKDAGAAKRRGGVTVTLNEIDFQPEKQDPDRKTARFRITVHYDTGGPAFESHRTWMFHNQVYLEDAKGQKLERSSNFHTALQTDGGVTVEYDFENLTGGPGEYKFMYIAPTLIINVPVSFEFENLLVPQSQ
jgi:hypothetical protein